jgi:hypothetical protein
MFVLQNAPIEKIEIDELTWQALPIDSGITKFDLTLSLEEKEIGFS